MTTNQLKWLDLMETQRSNLAKEGLTTRQLIESERANVAKEGLTARQLTETERTQQLHDEGFSPAVARANQAADTTKKVSETVKNWFSLLLPWVKGS